MIDRDELDKAIARHPASLLGRAYATDDPRERKSFADWLIQLCDNLGLNLTDKDNQ